jgi:hypothetical protein
MADAVTRLRDGLSYDPATGVFTWLVDAGPRKAGDRAGAVMPNGYRRIAYQGVRYEEHRLAWLFTHGRWPEALIDHINRDPGDNRLCNLREATRSQNAANKKAHSTGRSGLKGASFHKPTGRWQAQIMRDGKKRFLGLFDTAEDAHAAYVVAARAEFAEFARAA